MSARHRCAAIAAEATMFLLIHRTFLTKLLALGCLLGALGAPSAWAIGGGSPDPSNIPVLQALRVQVDALDNRFLMLTASVETSDLAELKLLADRLARIDAHFAVAAIGGGQPDPSDTPLNQALLGLRKETAALRRHVNDVLAAVAGIPIFEQITVTRTLRFMLMTSRMLIGRIDHALPSAMTPPGTDL
jgi:hypothetical protein